MARVETVSICWRDSRPALKAAAACGLVTVAAVATYYATDALHEWMPHIAAATATIALTVTIVETILRRDRDVTMTRLMRSLQVDLGLFAGEVIDDYWGTRSDSKQKSLPTDDLVGLLEFWLQERANADEWESGWADIVDGGSVCAERLRVLREQNLRVLPSDLLKALHDFEQSVIKIRRRKSAGREQLMQDEEALVKSAQDLAIAVNRHRSEPLSTEPWIDEDYPRVTVTTKVLSRVRSVTRRRWRRTTPSTKFD